MGSGSSRQHNAAGLKRRLSTLLCGSSTSRTAAESEDSVSNSIQGNKSSYCSAECGCLSERSTSTHEGLLFENAQTDVGRATSNEPVSVDNLNKEGGSSHPTHSAKAITSFSGESSSTQGVDDLVNHDHPESSVGSTPSGIEGNSDAETGVINSSSVVSSGTFSPDASGSGNGTNTREARRSGRRTMWDAFSRRGSRRQTEFQTNNPLPADDVDTIESRWSWLIEFGDDRRRSRRSLFGGERRQQSRSPLWERLLDGGGIRGGRTACRSGLHPDGQCLCGLQGGASGRTRMSRIVVLADVLFEVLDELQRQPTPLDQPTISNPAPKSAIDSLPIKFYEKPAAVESGAGVEKCYICLEEYKTGDEIRVLPCTHGYHTTCVDKWLKEIHGICPLCRGDVRTVPVDHA